MWSLINISSLNENCSLLPLNLLLLNHFVNVRIYSRTFISNKISKIGIHVIRKINERLFKQGSYPKDSPFLIEICFVPSPWTNLWPQAIRSRLTTIASFRVSWLGLESNENFFLKKISLNFSSKIYRSPRFIIYRRNFLPFPPFYRCDFFRIAENLERELSSTFHVLAWTRQRGNCKFYYIFAIISLRTHASIQDNWYFFISQRSLESQWATFVQ